MMLYEKTRAKQWSEDTIIEGLRTRFMCGTSGYEAVRTKLALPSVRTLQRRLEDLQFDVGFLHEVFYFLSLKRHSMMDEDADCGLVFDEMSISEVKSFCQATKKYYGDVTIAGGNGKATHAIVFMLVGIRARWKQVISYHFTGNSIEENVLKTLVHEIIELSETVGFRIHYVVSDCGSNNKRYWNDEGLLFTKDTVLNSESIPHPFDPSRRIEIIPDAVHVFKSGVQGWIANKIIEIPESVCQQNGLVSKIADINHLRDLVLFEASNVLKVASKLTMDDVQFEIKKSNHFDKMKVLNSYKYVNQNIAAALRFYSEASNRPEVLTTAFFVESLAKWFLLSSNRSHAFALSKGEFFFGS